MSKKIFVGLGMLSLFLALGAPLLAAHAQVPDAATWGTQVTSSTDVGAGYVAATLPPALKYIFYILAVGILIGLVIWGFHSIGFRKRM